MQISIADSIARLNPSPTLELSTKAAQLREEGVDVCSLTAGEPDFDSPRHVLETVSQRLLQGGSICHYAPSKGLAGLRTQIQKKFLDDNQLEYDDSQIFIGVGAKEVLFNALASLINPGDQVLIPAPYWVSYPEMVRALKGEPCILPCSHERDFVPSPQVLTQALTPKTKALILCSPNNPTGKVIAQEQYQALYDALKTTNTVVISDEIYEYLVYDQQKHYSPASLNSDAYERTLTVNGLSKGFAMTGWRVGYAGGPSRLIKAMRTLQSHSTSGPATLCQQGAEQALLKRSTSISSMVQTMDQRRQYVMQKLDHMPDIQYLRPEGAFYIFIDVSSFFGNAIQGSSDFCRILLEQKLLALVPGQAFGSDNFVRLSYAASQETLEKGLARFQAFLQDLKKNR